MTAPEKFLTFTLKDETFGVPIHLVREIIGIVPITSVPNTPVFVKGVINLRGKILPVINLRSKFNLEEEANTPETCIIVIDVGQIEIGVIVDTVKDVAEFQDEQIEGSPNFGNNNEKFGDNCIIGMGKTTEKVVILVDLSKALSGDQLAEIMNIKKAS